MSRNVSNTMSLGPSTFGMSRPLSIRQADSLPMGKGTVWKYNYCIQIYFMNKYVYLWII